MSEPEVKVAARRVEGFDVSPTRRSPAEGPYADSPRIQGEASFMQSDFWAVFKSRTGWRAYECVVSAGGNDSLLYALVRSMKGGIAFCYVPHGPVAVPEGMAPSKYLEVLAAGIRAAIREKIFFVRFDLSWEVDAPASVALKEDIDAGHTRLTRGSAVQVPDTVVLSLLPGPEQLLAAMKPKWRYNIRLAEKKGVEVKRQRQDALPVFQQLYRETAKRDGISIHTDSYYETLFDAGDEYAGRYPQPGQGRAPGGEGGAALDLSVWTATHDGQPLASIITLFFGKHATYLYGASSDEKRNLMPAYALQWHAIQAAKEAGCVDYDFFGIPPDDDPHHPMAGLYFFKTGFGGAIVHRFGCVDYPLMPVAYTMFRQGERIRLFWFKTVKKTLSGHVRARKTDAEKNRWNKQGIQE